MQCLDSTRPQAPPCHGARSGERVRIPRPKRTGVGRGDVAKAIPASSDPPVCLQPGRNTRPSHRRIPIRLLRAWPVNLLPGCRTGGVAKLGLISFLTRSGTLVHKPTFGPSTRRLKPSEAVPMANHRDLLIPHVSVVGQLLGRCVNHVDTLNHQFAVSSRPFCECWGRF